MKNSLILLAGAAALSLASCSQDPSSTTGTTTAADGSTTTTTTTTTTGGAPESEAAMEARAQRIADKMVADMKITDEATKTKIRTVYVNRAKRMGDLRTKYTADTTGMAAAMRSASSETDSEFKTVFTDPTQYQSYESSRTTYDDSNFMDDASAGTASDNMSSGSTSADNGNMSNSNMSSSTDNTMSSADGSMSSGSDAAMRSKTKMADGSKMKTKMDGTVKAKDADGSKIKIK